MRLSKTLAIVLAAGGAFACSDPSGPTGGSTTSVTIDLCGGLGFGWFAYQNAGGSWTQVTPSSDGKLTFDATDKVSVATAFSIFGSSFTQIINATAAELQGSAAIPCDLGVGDETLEGVVSGLTGEQYARISAATSLDEVDAFDTEWLLEELPAQAVDLVATRYASPFSQPATRVVVRRGVVVPQSGVLAPLDFAGSESASLESSVATFTSIPANGTLTASSTLMTARGTTHVLGELSTAGGNASQSVSYVSLPSSLRIPSDIHVLEATVFDDDGNTFDVTHYYKTPAEKTLAFGPLVSAPTLTNVATTPYVQPRFRIASQSAYPSAVSLVMSEAAGEFGTHVVSVLTTAGFSGGTPQTWDITVPDMTGAGYDDAWGLQTTSYSWSLTGYSVSDVDALFGETPKDGLTVFTGTRGSGDVSIFLAARDRLAGSRLLRRPGVGPNVRKR